MLSIVTNDYLLNTLGTDMYIRHLDDFGVKRMVELFIFAFVLHTRTCNETLYFQLIFTQLCVRMNMYALISVHISLRILICK